MAVGRHAAAARRAERRAADDAARPDAGGRRRASGSRRRRSCATRCGRCRRCATGSRRWRRAQLGDRDVFGLKVGPSGARRPGVPGARRARRRAHRAGDRRRRAAGARDAEVLQAALQQFYELRRRRRRRSTCRWSSRTPRRSRRGCRRAPAAACGSSCRSAATSAALRRAGHPQRRAGLPRRASTRRRAAHFDALETLRVVLGLPALPRRIECFDISTIQGSETVASMVVCEDGRMKRSEYRKFRIRVTAARVSRPDPRSPTSDGLASSSLHAELPSPMPAAATAVPACSTTSRRCARSCSGAIARLLGDGRAVPRSDPHRRRQGAAVGGLRGARGARARRTWSRSASRRRKSCSSRATAHEPIVLPRDDPALLLMQRIRDEAHRFAVTFHRKARSMRDLRSELDDVPGIGPRRRRALLTRFGSLAGVRRATREELTAGRRRQGGCADLTVSAGAIRFMRLRAGRPSSCRRPCPVGPFAVRLAACYLVSTIRRCSCRCA